MQKVHFLVFRPPPPSLKIESGYGPGTVTCFALYHIQGPSAHMRFFLFSSDLLPAVYLLHKVKPQYLRIDHTQRTFSCLGKIPEVFSRRSILFQGSMNIKRGSGLTKHFMFIGGIYHVLFCRYCIFTLWARYYLYGLSTFFSIAPVPLVMALHESTDLFLSAP